MKSWRQILKFWTKEWEGPNFSSFARAPTTPPLLSGTLATAPLPRCRSPPAPPPLPVRSSTPSSPPQATPARRSSFPTGHSPPLLGHRRWGFSTEPRARSSSSPSFSSPMSDSPSAKSPRRRSSRLADPHSGDVDENDDVDYLLEYVDPDETTVPPSSEPR